MVASIGANSSAHSFNNRTGIMSGPEVLRGLVFCRSFLTPSYFTVVISFIARKGIPFGSRIGEFGSLCVKTDYYCLLKMSALSLEALNKRPLYLNSAMPVESFRISSV